MQNECERDVVQWVYRVLHSMSTKSGKGTMLCKERALKRQTKLTTSRWFQRFGQIDATPECFAADFDPSVHFPLYGVRSQK